MQYISRFQHNRPHLTKLLFLIVRAFIKKQRCIYMSLDVAQNINRNSKAVTFGEGLHSGWEKKMIYGVNAMYR